MNTQQNDSLSEFYLACRNGDFEKVKYLSVRLSLYELNQFESNGSAALHAAAFFGHVDIVRLLMAHGALLTTLRNQVKLTPAEESSDIIREILLLPDVVQLRFQYTDLKTTTIFTPVVSVNDTKDKLLVTTPDGSIDQRPDWIDAYDNAHRIALENHEYMRKWLTKIPLTHILEMIKIDYLSGMSSILTENNFNIIQEYITLANEEDDVRYLLYAYTTPTSFFKQINIDLAQRGSDFRFENNISKKYRDNEPPIGFGQYLFAAVIINHPSIDRWRYTGVTYRGMNINIKEFNQYIRDARILTRSFLSTSKRIDTACLYLQYNDPILRPVLCVYRITQRHTSLSISDLSAVQGEDEVLIIPFVAFRVVKVDIDHLYISDCCRVSVIFLDEVTINEQRQSWPLAAVIEDNQLYSVKHHNINEEVIHERNITATIYHQERKYSTSLSKLYDQHRTSIHWYIERCLVMYSHWITNELENIDRGMATSILDPSYIFTVQERQWINENPNIFNLSCHDALFPSLTSHNKTTVQIDELLLEERSILILGDPGHGKTTWTRWLMWKCAQIFHASDDHLTMPLPLLIHIDDFVKYLDIDPTISLFDYICRFSIDDLNELTSGFVSEYLVYGHTLIILDGLDTIQNTQKRNHLIDLLVQFLKQLKDNDAETRRRNCLIVISNSIQSFPEEYFTSYRLSPLSSEMIDHFIDNWWNNHCISLHNGMMKTYTNQWNTRVTHLKSLFERHSSFQDVLSNALILSTICQWMTLQTFVETPLKKRIHYYSLSVFVLFVRMQRRLMSCQINQDIFIDLLADIAVHLEENSLSDLIETFDLRYRCYASIRTHGAHLSIDKQTLIDRYFTALIDQNSLFFLRDTNNYAFFSSSIRHYFACLSLIRTTTNSKVETIVERFLSYVTNANFREPLLLGLEWISWRWSCEDLNSFCSCLITNNNDQFHQQLPLGSMLLITTLPDIAQNPYEKTLDEAFNQFLIVSTNREWLIRFPIFVDYLVNGLNYLPVKIARTCFYHYFQTLTSIEHIRSVLDVLVNLIYFLRQIPAWMRNDDHENHWLDVLQYQSRIDYVQNQEGNDLFVIDRLLTTISILDSNVLTSGYACQAFRKFDIDIKQLSPQFLTVLIALYGGLNRFKRLHSDSKDTVVFSPSHMHRDSLHNSWLVHYLNGNHWTHLPDVNQIENQIDKISSENDSPEIVDLFITWICLKGVKQPWTFHKYINWPAFQHALFRFRRLTLYLGEFYYVKYDAELELEASSTFREDALSIIQQYTQKLKDETYLTFLHCIAVSLARLMIVGSQQSLFYSDGSYCPRMLDLNLSDSKLIFNLDQYSDSSIANFLPLLWMPLRPPEVIFLLEKYDRDTVLEIVDGIHPVLFFGHLTSFLLTLIPQHFQLLFNRFLNESSSFPFVCLLGEIVRTLSTQKKGDIRFALLLAILRIHFEKNHWTRIFLGLLSLTTLASHIRRYFQKFDHFLSDRYNQSPFNEETLHEDCLLIELTLERQRVDELRKTSTDCLKLYEASITIAVLSAALYERDYQLTEINDEIWLTVSSIQDSVLHLHALTIIWQLSQNYRIQMHQMEVIPQSALVTINNWKSIDDHTLRFVLWWTTFANTVDNRTIACQVHCLLDHLFVNIEIDSTVIQQIVCQSLLLTLDHDIYPYVRPRICRFIQNSRWSNESNLGDILQLQSVPLLSIIEKNSHLIVQNSSTSTLLASMYLMQFSIDVCQLPSWFNMETTINQPTALNLTVLEQSAIHQLNISSEHRIVSKEAARVMTDLFRISQEESRDYHSLEHLLAQCEFVEKSARSDVLQWLHYENHMHLSIFAFHAALLITKYSVNAVRICCQLLDYSTDKIRERAHKCLVSVCLLASYFTREQFIQLFTILIHACRTLSPLARETLINIDVRIDTIEYLDLIFTWEQKRIHLLIEGAPLPYYLTDNLELHEQDIKKSFFDYIILQNGFLDILEYLFEHAIDRCCQMQMVNRRRTIEEQLYLTELVQFIGRDWYCSLMTKMSICERKFASHLIALLTEVPLSSALSKAIVNALVINRSSYPYVPVFTLNEARQCLKNIIIETVQNPLSQRLPDDVLAFVIKHYYHTGNDEDEYLLIRLQQFSTRTLIASAADVAFIRCRLLKRPRPTLTDCLTLMNGEYIRLYHALMSIVANLQTTITLQSIVLDLICAYENELLPLFIEELCHHHLGHYSNYIHLTLALRDRLSIQRYISSKNNENFRQTILQWSESNEGDRIGCMRLLTAFSDQLTDDVKQMFLSAMWDRYQIQLTAFECVINIRRVQSRTIVEELYQELLVSKSLQRRYISAMLLVQLAKVDQISIYEVQQKLTETINQTVSRNGTITHKGEQKLDQALFNLLTQLSFIVDNTCDQLKDYHTPNYTNYNRELENIIDADRYASFVAPTIILH